MQTTYHQKTAARIARRNDPEYIKTRLTMRYALWYFVAFLCGILLCRRLIPDILPYLDRVAATLLDSPLSDKEGARDMIRAILLYATPALTLLLPIAIAGVTMCCGIICRAILALHALLFGVLGYGVALYALSHVGTPAFFIWFFTHLAYAAVLLCHAVEATVFSDRYRLAYHELRQHRETLTVQYILYVLAAVGTVIAASAASAGLFAWIANR